MRFLVVLIFSACVSSAQPARPDTAVVCALPVDATPPLVAIFEMSTAIDYSPDVAIAIWADGSVVKQSWKETRRGTISRELAHAIASRVSRAVREAPRSSDLAFNYGHAHMVQVVVRDGDTWLENSVHGLDREENDGDQAIPDELADFVSTYRDVVSLAPDDEQSTASGSIAGHATIESLRVCASHRDRVLPRGPAWVRGSTVPQERTCHARNDPNDAPLIALHEHRSDAAYPFPRLLLWGDGTIEIGDGQTRRRGRLPTNEALQLARSVADRLRDTPRVGTAASNWRDENNVEIVARDAGRYLVRTIYGLTRDGAPLGYVLPPELEPVLAVYRQLLGTTFPVETVAPGEVEVRFHRFRTASDVIPWPAEVAVPPEILANPEQGSFNVPVAEAQRLLKLIYESAPEYGEQGIDFAGRTWRVTTKAYYRGREAIDAVRDCR